MTICALGVQALGQDLSETQADSIFDSFDIRGGEHAHEDFVDLTKLESYLQRNQDSCRLAQVNSWKCTYYDGLGKLDSSVYFGHKALRLFNPNCDSLSLMSINASLTSVYLSLGENDKVIEIANQSLGRWNPEWPESSFRNAISTNKAIAHVYQGELDLGMDIFREILKTTRLEKNSKDEMDACNNLAALFGMLHGTTGNLANIDSSDKYITMAISISKSVGQFSNLATHFMNLSSNSSARGDAGNRMAYLDSAALYADKGRLLQLSTDIAEMQSNAFWASGDLESSLLYLRKHISFKDSLLGKEKIRAISEMQEKYESEKKEGQIKELQISQLNSSLREEQLTKTRNIYLFSALGVLLIAGGLFGRLRYTRKSKLAIQKEKDISENLLLNILPEKVAEELKAKGEAEAQLIDQVTVLFTDFKGFTAMSELLSPKELVRDLHECFSAFDRICEKYKIEKIKTIGDAYMAAAGLDSNSPNNVENVLRAALEMCAFVELGKQAKIANNQPYFEIRIGVHTGPVVAGIVGVKKFQYDIWGDTVNTASRMESSGAVGKVNVSSATYELVKDKFQCEFRGEIEAKGKGKIKMYFVEQMDA